MVDRARAGEDHDDRLTVDKAAQIRVASRSLTTHRILRLGDLGQGRCGTGPGHLIAEIGGQCGEDQLIGGTGEACRDHPVAHLSFGVGLDRREGRGRATRKEINRKIVLRRIREEVKVGGIKIFVGAAQPAVRGRHLQEGERGALDLRGRLTAAADDGKEGDHDRQG